METPALSLHVGQPVVGNPTVTWALPEGITSGYVTFYYLARQNGQSVPVQLTYQTIDINLGTWTFGGIPDGSEMKGTRTVNRKIASKFLVEHAMKNKIADPVPFAPDPTDDYTGIKKRGHH